MAQTTGAAVPRLPQSEQTSKEQPVQKGKVVPLPGVARAKGMKEQGLSDQETVAVLSLLLM